MARTRQDAEQLAELLDAGVDASDAGEFGQLITLARSIEDVIEVPGPSEAFRAALRDQILTAPPPAPAPTGITERVRRVVEERAPELAQSGRAVAATAATAAVVAAGGVGTVAQQALPGDLLYPVKGATEDVRLAFSSGDEERGLLHLQFAEERIEELEDGVGRLTSDLVADTLERLDDAVISGAADLLAAFDATADEVLVANLDDFTTEAGGRLTALRSLLPAEVAGRVDDSLEVLRRVEIQVDVATGVDAECDCDPTATIVGPQHDSFILRPGEGPAAPAPACDCGGTPTPTTQAPPPAPAPEPEPAPASPEPQPEPEPGASDPETVPRLPEPIDPIGDEVEQIVDDLLDDLPVDPVEELPDPIEEPVRDLREDLNETVGDVSETVDDILPGQLP